MNVIFVEATDQAPVFIQIHEFFGQLLVLEANVQKNLLHGFPEVKTMFEKCQLLAYPGIVL